jgi:hypothetical protein
MTGIYKAGRMAERRDKHRGHPGAKDDSQTSLNGN